MYLTQIILTAFMLSFAPAGHSKTASTILSTPQNATARVHGEDSAVVANQNPSPMVDYTRAHKRIKERNYPGVDFKLKGLLPKEIDVFVPKKDVGARRFDVLLHFHGANYVVRYAATRYPGDIIAASVTLGAGSSVYGRPFRDSTKFPEILDSIRSEVVMHLHHNIRFRHIILSAWSAGYGAIRQIMSTSDNYNLVDAVLLQDAIYAGYIPEGVPLAEGGKIDTADLATFLKLARDASRPSSKKKFLITHSEIFPGTFVSTIEASHYILSKLGVKERPVLRWGPLGMQQLSIAHRGHFAVYGFAGNTAPDHIDHFESLYYFLPILMKQ